MLLIPGRSLCTELGVGVAAIERLVREMEVAVGAAGKWVRAFLYDTDRIGDMAPLEVSTHVGPGCSGAVTTGHWAGLLP